MRSLAEKQGAQMICGDSRVSERPLGLLLWRIVSSIVCSLLLTVGSLAMSDKLKHCSSQINRRPLFIIRARLFRSKLIVEPTCLPSSGSTCHHLSQLSAGLSNEALKVQRNIACERCQLPSLASPSRLLRVVPSTGNESKLAASRASASI